MIRKFAVSAALLDPAIEVRELTRMEKAAHRHTFQYEPRAGMLYVRSRAISSRTNDNFDTFPAEELRQSWATFIGKPVFVNHHNDDHTRMRGVIIDAALHEDKAPDGTDDTWIEVLMEVDAVRFPLLAQAVVNRDIERTSMGCDVIESECSVCGNVARTPNQYCAHIARMKGQRVRRKNEVTGQMEDVLVHEICRGISFFENSLLVEDPADPTAFAYGVDTRGLEMVAKSRSVELSDEQKERFKGVTVKRDSKGYFVQTHRARSKSYDTIEKIPDSAISFIESTGALEDLPEAATRMHTNHSESYEETACPSCDSPYYSYLDGKYTCADCGQQYLDKTASKKAYNGMNPPPDLDEDGNEIEYEGPDNDDWISRAYESGPAREQTIQEMMIEDLKMGSKTATDDVRVPSQVETLRMHECPVCGADGRWNSDGRCSVCGYLPAPKPFQEPNTDVSGRVDRDGGWFDPDLVEATPFEAPDHQASKNAHSSPVQQRTSTTKGQKVELSQGDIPMTSKQNSVAMAARRRQASTNQALLDENARLRERVAQLTKRADEENPAQPVPEPSTTAPAESEAETVAEPEAQNVDVETPGGVLPDPIKAPGDVETIGAEAEDAIVAGTNQTDNVEAPVAGTTEVDPAAVIDVQPDHSAETLGEPAFTGDWINPGEDTVPNIGGNAAGGETVEARRKRAMQAQVGRQVAAARDRIWASIRLARLQIQAGLEQGDELELARKIEGSKDSMEAITREASTIQRLAQARPAAAARPQARQGSRRAPSLASDRPAVTGGVAVRGDDEALFE